MIIIFDGLQNYRNAQIFTVLAFTRSTAGKEEVHLKRR